MRPIRVVSIIEAASVTGPAKPLIEFARRSRQPLPGSNLPSAEVSLLTFQRGEPGGTNVFIEAVKQAGVELDVIHEQRAFQTSILAELRHCLAARQPDIVETNAVKSHFLIRMLGLHKKYRWVACHHGYVSTNIKVLAYNQLDRVSLPSADHMFTVCQPFAQQLRTAGVSADRITVRHNMIDPYAAPSAEDVAALRKQFNIPDGTKVIFTGGRLSREKGHLDLIEAADKLTRCEGLPPWQIVIAGEGPERAAMESRLAELKLSQTVRLAGHQNSLHLWYALADMAVLPSHSEGSPMMLLEAMAAGLPIVATAVGGVPEIAESEKNALLVPGRSPDQLGDALARILRDEQLREKLAGAARSVTEIYTPDEYCRKTLTVYRNVIQRQN